MIWDFMRAEDNYVVQEFTTSVVGIGALFFAYATAENFGLYFLKIAIAIVGLGASYVILIHAYGSIQQSRAARLNLVKHNQQLMKRWDEIMEWREKRRWTNYRFYYPVKRLIMYFSGFVCLAWANIILSIWVQLPFLWSFDLLVFLLVSYYAMKNWHKKDDDYAREDAARRDRGKHETPRSQQPT